MVEPKENCTDPEGCSQEKIDAGECCKDKEDAPLAAAAPDYSPGPGKVGPEDEEEGTESDGSTKEE